MKSKIKTRNIEQEYGIVGSNGQPFEIPARGSMALLALGYRGLMAWRAKRIEGVKLKSLNHNKLKNGPAK